MHYLLVRPLSLDFPIELSEGAAEKWLSAGFDDKWEYTVTFSGELEGHFGEGTFVYFSATDFVVNAEESWHCSESELQDLQLVGGIPAQRLSLPLPLFVDDPRMVAIVPGEYYGRALRIRVDLGDVNAD